MLAVAALALALWFPLTALVNYGPAKRALDRGAELECKTALACTYSLRSPVLPAPAQVVNGMVSMALPLTSKDAIGVNMLYTGLETLIGLALAGIVGMGVAILLALSRPFERSVLPWVVASQTVPIVALAPMLAVVLGRYGVSGLLPKAIIAAFIAFFPVAVGVAKGLRSPDPLALDLMRTYDATTPQVFAKLRLPTSLPYLFTAFKVAAAAALVGSMIAEIATVNFTGLGTMLLGRSYYGDIVGLWVIMIFSSLLGIALVSFIAALEQVVTPWRRAS